MTVRPEDLTELLGPERFCLETARKDLPPGVATGLAWTEAGGDVLYVEATLLPDGRGSAPDRPARRRDARVGRAAQSYVWSHAEQLGIDPDLFRNSGVHIHVPAGAVPKDGPSAGVAMADGPDVALHPPAGPQRHGHDRRDHADRPGVCPIGGVKEKVLAARRAGIRRVILPPTTKRTCASCRTRSARRWNSSLPSGSRTCWPRPSRS